MESKGIAGRATEYNLSEPFLEYLLEDKMKLTVVQDPVPPPPKKYVIELSQEEAEDLRTLFKHIFVRDSEQGLVLYTLDRSTLTGTVAVSSELKTRYNGGWKYKRLTDAIYYELQRNGV